MVTETQKLAGKVAIVTGASRGIGRAIAIALAENGARLVLASRDMEALNQTEALIKQAGGTAHCVAANIRNDADVERIVKETLETYGNIDILVNNAGMTHPLKGAEKLTIEDWDTVIGTNLTGTFLCTLRVARKMIAQNHGVIVNIGSIAGCVATPGALPYACSKAGINAMTKVLAMEWAEFGIRVNCVSPGWTETDLNLTVRQKKGRAYEQGMSRTPMKRYAKPEEIASAVVFLASDAASYITGANLPVDGGYTA